jgi:hypothetical protein
VSPPVSPSSGTAPPVSASSDRVPQVKPTSFCSQVNQSIKDSPPPFLPAFEPKQLRPIPSSVPADVKTLLQRIPCHLENWGCKAHTHCIFHILGGSPPGIWYLLDLSGEGSPTTSLPGRLPASTASRPRSIATHACSSASPHPSAMFFSPTHRFGGTLTV